MKATIKKQVLSVLKDRESFYGWRFEIKSLDDSLDIYEIRGSHKSDCLHHAELYTDLERIFRINGYIGVDENGLPYFRII